MHLPQKLFSSIYEQLRSPSSRPSLHPIPGTKPLTIEAALLPPLLYYLALLFLPPPPPPTVNSLPIRALRTALALLAGILFFRLPLAYYVPQSIGLTYQLGLVGLYGGCRVFDAFFITGWWFGHVPKRVSYVHNPRVETPNVEHGEAAREELWTDGGLKDPFSGSAQTSSSKSSRAPSPTPTVKAGTNNTTNVKRRLVPSGEISPVAPQVAATSAQAAVTMPRRKSTAMQNASYFLSKALTGPKPDAVTEHAYTELEYPSTFLDRASWALEVMLSMRGQGLTWTTADVRHTRKTWLPTIGNRVHSIVFNVLPIQLVGWYIISSVYTKYLASTIERKDYNPFATMTQEGWAWRLHRQGELFDTLPMHIQLSLTFALGAFLMSAFSLGHSLFAIMLHPLSPHPLAFFPPLYTMRVWSLTSVRKFWSFGWHRLFARLFLVWGVWPGEWFERTLTGKSKDQPADVGKVIGAFVSSAFVHSFSVRGVLAGRRNDAAGEARFFVLNGLAVVLEDAVMSAVMTLRKRNGLPMSMWYDAWIGRLWWITTVVFSGREFARGWVKSGLVREMSFR